MLIPASVVEQYQAVAKRVWQKQRPEPGTSQTQLQVLAAFVGSADLPAKLEAQQVTFARFDLSKGSVAARHTPRWLHVQYRRRIRGAKQAGKPGWPPFPCVYDQVVSWRGINAYCAAHGLQITDACSCKFYLGPLGRFAKLADRALRLIAVLSAGRLTADHDNLAFVIRKPPDPPAG